ncbi:type II toxin-antitoxin system prevent-host-death family antitoxin [Pectobacterium atrosepticum]|uniref:type II toxin-antitoxin system prevent-host-death family antitoxin n=1 Tax=Pectobacterium atrosepticum TaxID=29471 RepID=UPI00064FAD11|nr:type II toxin-antitoxin system prevent-host-death family antitoxin [Pectobacterium atrosepticum]KMK87634.1 putative plasmid stability protein [Pectobacterium atrosepticum ICMP 1526]QXE13085.1 type II toxin-antitoxin system prevent-host-death family antitoxin [Pectobacterium atrosepticum]
MAAPIYCKKVAGMTEFKRDPLGTVESAGGDAVAILSRNEPAFYLVPIELFERMMQDAEQRQAVLATK